MRVNVQNWTSALSSKQQEGLQRRRWRSWLEERCWKWRKTLEIREMHRDEGQAMPRDLGQWHLWLVTASRQDFLPSLPTPALISLQGKDAEPERRQHCGGGVNKQLCEKTKWGKTSGIIGSKINPSVQIYHGLLLTLSHPWRSPVFVLWQNVTQSLWLVSHCVRLQLLNSCKIQVSDACTARRIDDAFGDLQAYSWDSVPPPDCGSFNTVRAATEMHAFPKASGFWNYCFAFLKTCGISE